MPTNNRYEQQFLDALKNIFIGAKIEGESGYINLMRIKSRYFSEGVFPRLMKDIDDACNPFQASFREEMFDKMHDFFNRYFSESGSIYFRHTPLHNNVYEKVYTEDRDVVLFWKTHMLYYVKTDRLFNSMEVEIDDIVFFFDVSALSNKRSNEKREIIYTYKGYKQGKIVLTVDYSEKGRKTKNEEILKDINSAGIEVGEEVLARAFRVFEKQSEVDFFINKNAKAFLQEQFDLWMYQYLFSGESNFDQVRLNQLQAIKSIAYKIIDFISQFEDELVRIWNKPKFVLNSHYIITLDKITDPDLFQSILAHPGMAAQISEWRDLGMLDDRFSIDALSERDLLGEWVHARYKYLPLDTVYFQDLELSILKLFDDIDASLDGWLIHSENYQALNTILSKFRNQVKCIHIDPPYNTDTSGFHYVNTYQHSSWLTMMENRIQVGLKFLSSDGSFLCHIDENEYERLQLLFDQFSAPNAGTVVWDKRNPMNAGRGIAKQHEYVIWRSWQESPIYLRNDSVLSMLNKVEQIILKYGEVTDQAKKEYSGWVNKNPELSGGEKAYRYIDDKGQIYQSVSLRAPEPRTDPKFFIPLKHPVTNKSCPVPPNGFSRTPETLQTMIEGGEILFGEDESTQPRWKVPLTVQTSRQISSLIQDAKKGKSDLDALGLEFPYCHPVSLYKTLIGAALQTSNDITLDFFAGSGTSAHGVIDLNRADNGNRKYILIELGEHFRTTIIPRIKKVIHSDNWRKGMAREGRGVSHLAKYFFIEQYEDTLHQTQYNDGGILPTTNPYNSYVFLRDQKMLDAITLDDQANQVQVHLNKLYQGIDIAETISCVTGKWIKRLTSEEVEFQDGSKASLTNPDWELIKPLIWW